MNSYVKKRVLFEVFPEKTVLDGVVDEISPSNDFIKIDGKWYKSENVRIKSTLTESNNSGEILING